MRMGKLGAGFGEILNSERAKQIKKEINENDILSVFC